MRNAIIGVIIGIVAGIVLGTTVIAPRLAKHHGGNIEIALKKSDAADAPEATAPAAPASGQDSTGDVIRLKMASAFPESLPAFGTLAKRLERLVWRLSDGSLDLRFHAPGALVSAEDALDAVASGAIDAHFTALDSLSDETPALGFFAGPAFGTSTEAYLGWMSGGGGRQLFEEILAEQDLQGVLCGLVPQAGGGWFQKPLKTVEDLNGLRIRAPGVLDNLYGRVGATPVSQKLADTVADLEQGKLDGAVLSAPHVDVALGAPRNGMTYYLPDWRAPSTVHVLLIKLTAWEELGAIQQTQIRTACGDNIRHAIGESEALQYDALRTIVAAGSDVTPWPAEIIDAMRAAWTAEAEALSESDEIFARVLKSYRAFVKGQSIWEDLARP